MGPALLSIHRARMDPDPNRRRVKVALAALRPLYTQFPAHRVRGNKEKDQPKKRGKLGSEV